MRFFYVDYENVMDSGLNGIAKLTSSDTVKIFYSEDAQRLSFGTHRRIIDSQATFAYKKVSPDMKTIKNALDILIIQDLEVIMKTDKSSEYYIVSNDNDFDGFIEEKIKKNYMIWRIAEVCQSSAITKEATKPAHNSNSTVENKAKENANNQKKAEQENARKKKEQVIRSHIGRYLKEYKEWKEYIVEAYMESSSRQELNNKLQQTFENEAVHDILSALRNLIKDMPGR